MKTSPRHIVVVLALAALAAACTPVAGSTPTTTAPPTSSVPNSAPVVSSFVATPAAVPAPALVALAWTVADAQGSPLTCSIDGNGDGTVDLTVTDCQGSASRNVSLPVAGTYHPTLTVSDGALTTSGTTTVVVQPGVSEPFDIVIRPVAPLAPDVQATFDAAAARWSQVLVRGIPATTGTVAAGACLPGSAAIGPIDDLVIDVQVAAIDGAGGVLGSAGPCLVGSDGLTRVGDMSFDSADVANLLATGQLQNVILHEMAHVLGFGTLWTNVVGLTSGFTGSDPRFLGPRAEAAWSALGRTGGVPVEADGGSGTAYGHWDEVTFRNELMTGWLNAGSNPLSAVSIASLADLGYAVDLSTADPYAPSMLGAFRLGADVAGPPVGTEVLRTPIGTI